jgi:triosephosphate isomerase
MRQKFVAGNWKMNLNLPEAQALTSEIVQMLHDETLGAHAPQVVICPPFPLLSAVGHLLGSTRLAASTLFWVTLSAVSTSVKTTSY